MFHSISRTIWQALHEPPQDHPLFRLVSRQPAHRTSRAVSLALFGLLVLLGYWAIQQRVTLLALLSIISTPLLLMLGGMGAVLYATSIALTVSGALHRIQAAKLVEILGVTPPGRFGTTWVISIGQAGQRFAPTRLLFGLRLLASLFITALLLCLVIMLLVLLLGGFDRWADLFYPPAVQLSTLLALGTTYYLGTLQAVAGGLLVGMLVPTSVPNANLADLLTLGVFLCLQSGVYLLAAICALVIFPAALRALGLTGWLSGVSLPLIGAAAFVLLQEMLNLLLWRILRWRLADSIPI